jgi:hypothetical protein
MLIGTIYLKQTHLILRDVDGSEVSITLEDSLDLYTFIKEHKRGIELRIQENWQDFITTIDQTNSDIVQ